jgi:transcriptional regulator with XRE-family HTH domain
MEMKVDSDRVRSERERRAWSQEQLASVSGLSLRTVQRIEKNGSASFESLRSLAAVLELDVMALRIDSAPTDLPRRPAWVAALFFGSQWIDMGKRQHERLEAAYVVIGLALAALGLLGLFGLLANSGEPFLVAAFVFFTLAYVATLNVRIGDRYAVWPRDESRATRP